MFEFRTHAVIMMKLIIKIIVIVFILIFLNFPYYTDMLNSLSLFAMVLFVGLVTITYFLYNGFLSNYKYTQPIFTSVFQNDKGINN